MLLNLQAQPSNGILLYHSYQLFIACSNVLPPAQASDINYKVQDTNIGDTATNDVVTHTNNATIVVMPYDEKDKNQGIYDKNDKGMFVRNVSVSEWINCVQFEKRPVCDPQMLLPQARSTAIKKIISGICRHTTCVCKYPCFSVCDGIQSTVVVIPQYIASKTIWHNGKLTYLQNQLIEIWRNSVNRCYSDILVIMIVHSARSAAINTHIYNSATIVPECVDHVATKTQFILDQGNISLAIVYQLQLYKHILLEEYLCVNKPLVEMSKDRLLAIIYVCCCVPIMGMVMLVFFSSSFRGKKAGDAPLTGYRRNEIDDEWSSSFRSNSNKW